MQFLGFLFETNTPELTSIFVVYCVRLQRSYLEGNGKRGFFLVFLKLILSFRTFLFRIIIMPRHPASLYTYCITVNANVEQWERNLLSIILLHHNWKYRTFIAWVLFRKMLHTFLWCNLPRFSKCLIFFATMNISEEFATQTFQKKKK